MPRIVKTSDIRKQELLEIGFKLYMNKGLSGLNIKDIVTKADVATGLFYYYFNSKEAFVDEALDTFIAQNMAPIQKILMTPAVGLRERIQRTLDAFWRYVLKMAPYRSATFYHTPQHLILNNKLLTQMQPVILSVVTEGVKTGVLKRANTVLTANYLLYGLSCVLNTQVPIDQATKRELDQLVFTTLGIEGTAGNSA